MLLVAGIKGSWEVRGVAKDEVIEPAWVSVGVP